MVGVLVSPGYGTGWSTYNPHYEIAVDARVIEYWLQHKDKPNWRNSVSSWDRTPTQYEFQKFLNKCGYDNSFNFHGLATLELCWVKCGTYFRVREYDGHEYIEQFDDSEWLCA